MSTPRLTLTACLTLALLATPMVVAAEGDDRISYASQPDRLAIFLNDIAYAQDAVTLPGDLDVRVVLPPTVVPDTLVLREDGERVPDYRLDRRDGQLAISWAGRSDAEVRDVTLEYVLSGVSWRPTYDLWLGPDDAESVDLDLLAEITDSVLELDAVETLLIAGSVQVSGAMPFYDDYRAEFDGAGQLAAEAPSPVVAVSLGQADIQHVYAIGDLTAEPGETAYRLMTGGTLPAERRHVWDARMGNQVAVIYDVTNETDLPFPQGGVRTYQGGLFIGTGAMPTTPIDSVGEVVVGHLQDVRVRREETQAAIDLGRFDYENEVTLTIENHSQETLTIEVIDQRVPHAELLEFAIRPTEEPGNVLRWTIVVEPGATETITYDYKVD